MMMVNQLVTREKLVKDLNQSYLDNHSFNKENYFLQLFVYQYHHNPVYRRYCDILARTPQNVFEIRDIPLLPITAFKVHEVKTGSWNETGVFKSSGTTQTVRSQHFVRDTNLYLNHVEYIWNSHFGPLEQFCFYSLLPGYVERGDSSLICMVDHFINKTRQNGSMFVHGKETDLEHLVKTNTAKGKIPLIFGVSYALLSFLETNTWNTPDIYIVETGGMKGLREDMTKEELFVILKKGFVTSFVYSEYGMTELFSQAYTTQGAGFSFCTSFIPVIRQLQDPLTVEDRGKQGMVGCLDAANIDSCAFILTEDTGYIADDHLLYLTGRLDNSDIRGCNLLLL
ncbi:MAG: acyl transferase [Saprospiraceae bacterium]|nr:acyl transferase [Saprospiraceae bacterium]